MSNQLATPLVTAQLMLIAAIALPPNHYPTRLSAQLENFSVVTALALILIFLSAVLALWALYSMRFQTFSIMPRPVSNGVLCQSGPYSSIRHPMYTAIIAACAGFVLLYGDLGKGISLVALTAVLIAKLNLEEHLLLEKYDEYRAYQQKTARLVPGLY